MKIRIPHFWEPEETVGGLWHDAISHLGAEPHFEDQAFAYADVKNSIGLLFRGLGGPAGVEITPLASRVSRHRVSGLRKLAHDVDHATFARYNGDRLVFPAEIALFQDGSLSRMLYLYIAALSAQIALPCPVLSDPLQNDIARLSMIHAAEKKLLRQYAGCRAMRNALAPAILEFRPNHDLPDQEAELEMVIRAFLGDDAARQKADSSAMLQTVLSGHGVGQFHAADNYMHFRPVSLWPMLEAPKADDAHAPDENPQHGGSGSGEEEKSLVAKRRASDQAERRDSLILHRFESIMSWVEFLNINRAVEDEDEDTARKAAGDLDEVSLARHSKAAKTKLKFHLDLAPRDVDRTRLIGEETYPEWDWKRNDYLPDHVRVFERTAEEKDDASLDTPRARRRIAAVKRQFEALRPKRQVMHRQADGFDLDLDEVIRARCDFLASGDASERIYHAMRNNERDLAVSVLVDVSRSTESAVTGRPVIEIAREALTALIGGIETCGDSVSVHAFSSLRRDNVLVERVKDFDETGAAVRRRIMGLTPRFYTRLGAAIRHVSQFLSRHPAQKRLLLVITDGKPNDLDHYEGRHGIEDTRRAVMEARRLGLAVFAITVDTTARDYVPYLFGRNGFAIIPHAERLVDSLPDMYRHIVD